MKDKTLRSSGESDEDLACPSPCNLYNKVPNTLPSSYSSLPELLGRVYKELLADT